MKGISPSILIEVSHQVVEGVCDRLRGVSQRAMKVELTVAGIVVLNGFSKLAIIEQQSSDIEHKVDVIKGNQQQGEVKMGSGIKIGGEQEKKAHDVGGQGWVLGIHLFFLKFIMKNRILSSKSFDNIIIAINN